MTITAFQVALRFMGVKEWAGPSLNNPFIMSMLQLDQAWPQNDEVPWCSAFVNFVCWLLALPRTKDLRARSWLFVQGGIPVALTDARVGFDVVILNRGGSSKPIIDGPGHVGFYAGQDVKYVYLTSGNQDNGVSTKAFLKTNVLGVRRLLADVS